jgi:uridine kinase
MLELLFLCQRGLSVYLIGIAGGSGSGKTTFANKVLSQLSGSIQILHLDSYYLPLNRIPSHLYSSAGRPNFDHPEAFDWALVRQHLQQLKHGAAIEVPTYDFKSNSRGDGTVLMPAPKVLIFEGIFSLYDHMIRNLMDIKTFLHVEADIRFTRRLDRDVQERGRSLDSVISQYYETVRPMYKKYLEPQRQYADFIVGEETDVGASILSAKVREVLDRPESLNSSNDLFI